MIEKIQAIYESLKTQVQTILDHLKERLFGANNENLDFFIDSFNRLNTKQKILFTGGAVIGTFLIFLSIFVLYFNRIEALQTELSKSFQAIHSLQSKNVELAQEQKRFEVLESRIQSKVSSLRIKPYFESMAKTINANIDNIDDKSQPLATTDPLSKKFEYSTIDIRLNNISIPKLLNFINEFEKSDQLLQLQDLTIRARYGTKLYFDTNLKIIGYKLIGG